MNRNSIILGLLAIISGLFWNEINIYSLKSSTYSLSIGKTVKTADDASYLIPAENYIEGKGFRNNLKGDFSYFMRPPGYSLLYLSFRCWMPQKTAIYCLKFFQIFLFGLSVSCLFLLFLHFKLRRNIAIALVGFYAVSGIGIGFLYYTLTEAITPALIIFLIFFLTTAKRKTSVLAKRNYYLLAFVIFGFIFITRPVLGIFALPIPFFIFSEQLYVLKTKFIYLSAFIILGFGPMLIWQIRSANIAGEIVGLHPIYSTNNIQTPYRPIHGSFWEFAKSWGEKGEQFHAYTDEFWRVNYSSSVDKESIGNIINSLPIEVQNEFSENELRNTFELYAQSIVLQKECEDEKIRLSKGNFSSEKRAIALFEKMTAEYRQSHFVKYQFLNPIKVFAQLAFHSNLSLYIFQQTYRGNIFMEIWRLVCFIPHSLAFLSLLIVLFLPILSLEKKVVFICALLYIFYLIYFQRGIEERYSLPILPLLLLNFGFVINWIRTKYFTN